MRRGNSDLRLAIAGLTALVLGGIQAHAQIIQPRMQCQNQGVMACVSQTCVAQQGTCPPARGGQAYYYVTQTGFAVTNCVKKNGFNCTVLLKQICLANAYSSQPCNANSFVCVTVNQFGTGC